jgi:hypothetical protein
MGKIATVSTAISPSLLLLIERTKFSLFTFYILSFFAVNLLKTSPALALAAVIAITVPSSTSSQIPTEHSIQALKTEGKCLSLISSRPVVSSPKG